MNLLHIEPSGIFLSIVKLLHVYVYICACTHTFLYIHMSVYIYIYVCVHAYVCIYNPYAYVETTDKANGKEAS